MNLIRPLYTIGYGNRTATDFIDLLKKFEIQYLIDVRSKPVSKFNSDFSRVRIEMLLHRFDIRYVYFGKLLGGLPEDPCCYTDGRVDYAKVEQQPWYQAGIARLKTAWEKQIPVALMCTELKPESCHRSKLIGQTLKKMGIHVVHIDEHGEVVSQEEVILRITNGQVQLFEDVFVSRKKYHEKG